MDNEHSSISAQWLVLLVLLVPPLYGQSCPPSSDPCKINLRAGCDCVEYPASLGIACDLAGGGDGWCISGVCEDNLCTGADCEDFNECTLDYCNPLDGACAHDPMPGLHPACQDVVTGVSGACFGTVCVTGDACVVAGAGRINCCSDCSGSNYATTCEAQSLLPDGSSCDPTGVEAPGSGQAGQCQGGVCVWSSGPCADESCPDEGFDCTKDWCDPATYLSEGCRRDPVELAPLCDGDSGTACVGGICKSQNQCVSPGVGAQNCCPPDSCSGASGCIDPDAYEYFHCDPSGGYGANEFDSEYRPGFCNANAECLWPLCSVDDPSNPGHLIELDCDDGNECTDDACDPATGACTHSGRPGYPSCDNGNGICFGWTCRPLPPPPECLHDVNDPDLYFPECDDGKECTYDRCNASDQCTNPWKPNGTSCNNGNGNCIFGNCAIDPPF